MQEFQVILNYDLVLFSFKGFTWIVFLFEWYSYIRRFILFVAEMNLCPHYCIKHFVHLLFDFIFLCVCTLANEWSVLFVIPFCFILNDARTSLPNSDVYHIWAWICCFDCHHHLMCSFIFGGRSGSSRLEMFWVLDGKWVAFGRVCVSEGKMKMWLKYAILLPNHHN